MFATYIFNIPEINAFFNVLRHTSEKLFTTGADKELFHRGARSGGDKLQLFKWRMVSVTFRTPRKLETFVPDRPYPVFVLHVYVSCRTYGYTGTAPYTFMRWFTVRSCNLLQRAFSAHTKSDNSHIEFTGLNAEVAKDTFAFIVVFAISYFIYAMLFCEILYGFRVGAPGKKKL